MDREGRGEATHRLPRPEIILFDNDGTLVPSHEVANPAIQEAFALFCREKGIDLVVPTDARIRDLTGQPGETFFRSLLPEEHAALAGDLRARCLDHEVAGMLARASFYDGLGEMLRELKRSGSRLAIVTNGGERYIGAVARRLCYDLLFDRVYFHGMEGLDDKGAMARRAVADLGGGRGVLVGDRRSDLVAARSAGLAFVGCLYGYGGPEELRGADILADSPQELARLLMDACYPPEGAG